MNITKGMNRTGIVLGSILGGAFAVFLIMEVTTYLKQKHRYDRYERLASTPAVEQAIAERSKQLRERQAERDKNLSDEKFYEELMVVRDTTHLFTIQINQAGIKQISIRHDYNDFNKYVLDNITTTTGETLERINEPQQLSLPWLITPTILGFLIPWGTCKALAWIVNGFKT